MSEVKKVATRQGYADGLVELGKTNHNLVVLDADLAAATQTAQFKKEFPDRFFNCGIAEQNMIGVAAGLAAAGKTVFASSFAMFAAGRAFEQVRNTLGYTNLPVNIGATHAGISVGEDGATHQCNEDLSIMRTIPGMVVINPGDAVEARAAVYAAINYDGPVYLRFGRLAVPVVNDEETFEFEIGKGQQLREGKDVTIVATGYMVHVALEAAEALKAEGKTKVKISFNGTTYEGEAEIKAVEEFLAKIGLKKEEMVACGDGRNDVTMIKYAGMGVAMENACEEVKEVSNYVTLSNDEDGVAVAIEKFFII